MVSPLVRLEQLLSWLPGLHVEHIRATFCEQSLLVVLATAQLARQSVSKRIQDPGSGGRARGLGSGL